VYLSPKIDFVAFQRTLNCIAFYADKKTLSPSYIRCRIVENVISKKQLFLNKACKLLNVCVKNFINI